MATGAERRAGPGREAQPRGLALLLRPWPVLRPDAPGWSEAGLALTGMPAPPCSMRRRSWRLVASGICDSWPTASMYARRSDGVSRFSIRCACSGVFGSPKAVIFLIAAASSGFSRSRAAIDAFWNHRLKRGTLERKATTGRRYFPFLMRPSSTNTPSRSASTSRRSNGIQAQNGTARSYPCRGARAVEREGLRPKPEPWSTVVARAVVAGPPSFGRSPGARSSRVLWAVGLRLQPEPCPSRTTLRVAR